MSGAMSAYFSALKPKVSGNLCTKPDTCRVFYPDMCRMSAKLVSSLIVTGVGITMELF